MYSMYRYVYCRCIIIYGVEGLFAYSAYSQSNDWLFIDCLHIFMGNSRFILTCMAKSCTHEYP
eukprot:COSAG02_NODE_2275_length_9246_cov_50.124194_7_plen_63_part_00